MKKQATIETRIELQKAGLERFRAEAEFFSPEDKAAAEWTIKTMEAIIENLEWTISDD